METKRAQDAYNLMVATYDNRRDDVTYELLGNDTIKSIFDEIKDFTEFRNVKNQLNVRTFRQRARRIKKQKQLEYLIASKKEEDDEAKKKLKDIEFSANAIARKNERSLIQSLQTMYILIDNR